MRPAVHPQALPDPVPEHEPAVEDRDPGLLPRHVLAVDVDQDLPVAGIGTVLVGALAHGVVSFGRVRAGARVAPSQSPKTVNATNRARVHWGMERERNVHCTSAHSPEPPRSHPQRLRERKRLQHVLQARSAFRHLARRQALEPYVAPCHRRPRCRHDGGRHTVGAASRRRRVVERAGEHQYAEHDDEPALEDAQGAGFQPFDVLEPQRRRHQRDARHETAREKLSLNRHPTSGIATSGPAAPEPGNWRRT